jgi:hypothetical protein
MGLVSRKAREDADLDFKGANSYIIGGEGADELAKDVTGMANARGGLIVIGIAEDDQACAKAPALAEISAKITEQMEQILRSRVVPWLSGAEIRPVECPAAPGTGLYLIGMANREGRPPSGSASMRSPWRRGRLPWASTKWSSPVTSQNGKGRLFSKERYRLQILPPVAVLEVPTPLAVTHVQPLPGGKVLIASARTPGTDTAEVWDGNGHLEHAGLIGDAIEHLLSTHSGAIWTGYFDEGLRNDARRPRPHPVHPKCGKAKS